MTLATTNMPHDVMLASPMACVQAGQVLFAVGWTCRNQVLRVEILEMQGAEPDGLCCQDSQERGAARCN